MEADGLGEAALAHHQHQLNPLEPGPQYDSSHQFGAGALQDPVQNNYNLNQTTLVIQNPQNQNYYGNQPYQAYYPQTDTSISSPGPPPSLEFGSSAGYYGADFSQPSPGYQYFPAPAYQEPPSYQQQQQPGYASFAPRQDGEGQRFNGFGPGAAPPEGPHPVKGPPGACCVAEPATGGPAGAGGLPAHHQAHRFRCLHPAPEEQRQHHQQHHQHQQQQQLQPRQQQAHELAAGPQTQVGPGRGPPPGPGAGRHPAVAGAAAATRVVVGRAQVMARRKNATRETTSLLRKWLADNTRNPYPSKSEKMMLSMVTKMSLTQVSTWFANARRRMKKENKMLAWVLQRPSGRPSEQQASHSHQQPPPDPRRGSWYFRSLVELAASRARPPGEGRRARAAAAAARRAQVSSEPSGDSESAAESPSTTSQLGAEEPTAAAPGPSAKASP